MGKSEHDKLKFLAAYEKLCLEHGMMVIQVSNEFTFYKPFAVLCFTDPTELTKSLEEMKIEPLRYELPKDD